MSADGSSFNLIGVFGLGFLLESLAQSVTDLIRAILMQGIFEGVCK